MLDTRLIDLHTHTNQSDGSHSPESLVELAARRHLAGVGITDHDEVGGIARAMVRGDQIGVEVIPGVELSACHAGYDVHILGYFVNYFDPIFLAFLSYLKEERVTRTYRIVEKLCDLGLPVQFEAVQRQAGDGCIGRPHVAEVLVQAGHVLTFQDAFNYYLAEGKPAFVPKVQLTPREAIDAIHRAGGAAVLAHPGQNLSLQVVLDVIRSGVEGIEIIHPKHTWTQKNTFQKYAAEYGLVQTGGSDFHGGRRGEEKFGQFTVTIEHVQRLKECVERRRREWL